MTHITEVTQNTLPSTEGLLVLDFSATWCGPCRSYTPIFHQVASETGSDKISFASVDIDKNPKLAAKFGIQAVPTTVILSSGTKVAAQPGAITKALLQALISSYSG